MSKATLNVRPAVDLSKLDPIDWSRATYAAAHAMARRMIKDRRTSTAAAAWTWFLQHARRRFTTPTAWRIAQAAGRIVFDARTVGYARAGSVADLERQGLVRRTRRPRPGNLTATVPYRAASFERLRDYGISMAWGFDPLMSSNNRGLRVHRARQLREDRARRRDVAREMAYERRRILAEIEADDRLYVLTDAGLEALREAGMLD